MDILAGFDNIDQLCRACDYLVTLLAAALNGSSPSPLPGGLSWKHIFLAAKVHSVETMAFSAARDLVSLEDPNIYVAWEKRRMMNLAQYLTQREEGDVIISRFKGSGITAVPLKGDQLACLYPRPEYRQKADLDYLIPEESSVEAEHILLELGYEKQPEDIGTDYHTEFHKAPYMGVELHSHLLPSSNASAPYFDTVWDNLKDDGTSLQDEFLYLFLVAHLAKHYFIQGSGIRSVMDMYLFKAAFAEKLDWENVQQELDRLDLLKFAEQIEEIGQRWFASREGSLCTGRLHRMEREIFAAGTHGSSLSRVAGALPEDGKGFIDTSRYLLRRLFPSREYLQGDYPLLNRFHALLPVFWAVRIFRRRPSGTVISELRDTVFNNDRQ